MSRKVSLYYSPGACSLAIHAALRQAGLDFDLIQVDVRAGQQRAPAYAEINPEQRVPTLVVDGQPLHEVVAIALWIDEQAPGARLLPRGGLARARHLALIMRLASNTHPLFRALWRSGWYAEDNCAHDAIQATARQRLRQEFIAIEQAVAEAEVLNGESLGFADLYAAVFLRWSEALTTPRVLGLTGLRYRTRLTEFEPLRQALDAEGVSLDHLKRRSDP